MSLTRPTVALAVGPSEDVAQEGDVLSAEVMSATEALPEDGRASVAAALSPLVEVCARHHLSLARAAHELALVPAAKRHTVASLIAEHVDEASAGRPMMTHTLPLMFQRVAALGEGASEVVAWVEHFEALGLAPDSWVEGPRGLAKAVMDVRPERRARILHALAWLWSGPGSAEERRALLGAIESLCLGDLQELTRRVGAQRAERRGLPPSARQAARLVELLRGERRWRAQEAALPTGIAFGAGHMVPQAQQGGLFGAPAMMPQARPLGHYEPAGLDGGALSEWARDALDTLEFRVQGLGTEEETAQAISALRAAIGDLWPEDVRPRARKRARASSPHDEALERVATLVDAGPLRRLASLRPEGDAPSGAQVLAMMWRAIDLFDVGGFVARGEGADQADSQARFAAAGEAAPALKDMWRRGFLESLVRCGHNALPPGPDVYTLIERLLADLPPVLRSDRRLDREELVASLDDGAVFNSLMADFAARPQDRDQELSGHPMSTPAHRRWRSERWLGICLARAQVVWSAPDHPARQRLMARCLVEAEQIRVPQQPTENEG